ncbi:aldehyde dehydrogenase [Adlercreutzia sp. ZJ242]|uniref:aldehyde dehydrogenase n=1 Tax=Adlercreutzia sp. ZJ242 TaxID=2709409 RepID=UPI001F153088|nr:aldehyde dehydrogenase [Adlercreutzia sp. ZJ242]
MNPLASALRRTRQARTRLAAPVPPCRKRTAQAPDGIGSVMERQRAFFATGATIDVDFRLRALKRLDEAIRSHEAEIKSALRQDLGKSSFEGYLCEIGLTLSELGYQISHLRRWARPRHVLPDLANFPSSYRVVPEPYGVTLVMSPWNYPFMLALEPLIGAVAAGNCCVVKPSAYSPATSALIARILRETFEPGHVDVVLGGRAENAELLEQRFDYIFFTGSVEVGKLVQQKAARHLTPVTLELGGKSPCVIARDADLDVAAARVAFGKWLNVGQTCVAPDYVLVDEAVEMELAEKLAAAAARMYGADALGNPDYGHMVNEKHFKRVSSLIDPAKVVYGGRVSPETLQIEPTIMMGCSGDDPAMQQEIFGPVLPIISVRSMDEAEAFVKGREKPLALYLFTRDKQLERRFLGHVPFGGGCVNDTIVHLATSRMGFGGVGASGMGAYHGRRSFETFSHLKSVLKKGTWCDLPLRYQPYSAAKLSLVRLFLR